MSRKPKLLNLDLLNQMHARGEFANTTYIELQMAGEPTLHPALREAIDYLHEIGLLVGLSTHGLRLDVQSVQDAVLRLDALTISIDSVAPEIYERLRYPAKFKDLERCLDAFFATYCYLRDRALPVPIVDLQVIETDIAGGSQLEAVKSYIAKKGWPCRVRTVEDSFVEMIHPDEAGACPRTGSGFMCLEPFTSVSINADGDVVPCCLIFDPKKSSSTYLGNIYESTLRDIWEGTKARHLRWSHRAGTLADECKQCYQWPLPDITGDIVRQIARAL